MEEFIIPRAKLVELPILSAAGFIQMPNNLDDLNHALIVGYSVIDSTALTTAPSGNVIFAAADLPKISVVLKGDPGSLAIIDTIPAYMAVRELNFGHYFLVKKFKWNSSASGVQIMATGLTVGQSICIVMFYIPVDRRTGRELL